MERGEFQRRYVTTDSAKFYFQRMCLELSRVVREQSAKMAEEYGKHVGTGDGERACRIVADAIRSLQPKASPPSEVRSPDEDEKLFVQLIHDYKRIGYGWMMQRISEIWRKEYGDGAFFMTDTYSGFEAKQKRCATEGHDWQAGENPWCDRCNRRADQVEGGKKDGKKDDKKCDHEGPAQLRCTREAGHDGTHAGGVITYKTVPGMFSVDQEAEKTKAREEARRKALVEVHDYLKMFACNCDAGNRGDHRLTCPMALSALIFERIDK